MVVQNVINKRADLRKKFHSSPTFNRIDVTSRCPPQHTHKPQIVQNHKPILSLSIRINPWECLLTTEKTYIIIRVTWTQRLGQVVGSSELAGSRRNSRPRGLLLLRRRRRRRRRLLRQLLLLLWLWGRGGLADHAGLELGNLCRQWLVGLIGGVGREMHEHVVRHCYCMSHRVQQFFRSFGSVSNFAWSCGLWSQLNSRTLCSGGQKVKVKVWIYTMGGNRPKD